MSATPALVVKMLPLILRLLRHRRDEKRRGREAVFDPFRAPRASQEMGVPLGGLGAGTITRGRRGGFVRWQLRPGVYRYGVAPADQFSLWVRRGVETPRSLVLSPRPEGVPGRVSTGRAVRGPGGRRELAHGLAGWNWALDGRLAAYYALYPRAWTTYAEPAPGLRLTCRQISPVIPHDYRDSSLPVGVFVWTIQNTGREDAQVALMFSFQNGTGGENDTAGGHWNEAMTTAAGVLLHHVHRQAGPRLRGDRWGERRAGGDVFEDPLTFALTAEGGPGITLSRRTRFSGNQALDLWNDFAADGRLKDSDGQAGAAISGEVIGAAISGEVIRAALSGEVIGAAVTAGATVPAGESRDLVFALAWDMPVARFGSGRAWYRRYTRFYGRDGKAAETLALDALRDYPSWEKRIEAWQAPVLEDPDLPDWYKSALFNETYYIADGGTIWTDGPVEEDRGRPPDAPSAGPAGETLPEPDYGHFAYLEGHEYPMYNTYDVHFYASFALAMLWPELELSLQRDFARAVRLEDPEEVTLLFSGGRAPRKVRGAVPHDLGTPFDDPWRRVNAYNAQDVSRWKDLGPKFVLQVHRDFAVTKDLGFLREVWDAVEEAITYLERFDRDGDGLIENEGFPDQTYDVWSAAGPSAYSGGLWLGCLAAAAAMAEALGRRERADHYAERLARAGKAYQDKLWNGSYYDYDASRSGHRDSVMSDQLAGHWYAGASGLGPLLPPEQARSALRRIFELNVMGNERGRRGALNGVRPDGRVDRTCLQSQETWTGTTYALAAAMLWEGMTGEAFITAEGIYQTVWRDFGLWFQTPEAVGIDGVYRSLGYMRPLAVWAMQWAWEQLIPSAGALVTVQSSATRR